MRTTKDKKRNNQTKPTPAKKKKLRPSNIFTKWPE